MPSSTLPATFLPYPSLFRSEVVLFAVGQQVLRHTGGIGLLLLASAGGLLRWSLTGITGDSTLLVVLNLLHAATFGCAHLGAMRLLSEHVEPDVSATAQRDRKSTRLNSSH